MYADILKLIRDARNLPALPPAVPEIIRLMREDAPPERLAGLLGGEPVLCEQLLRLLSSPALDWLPAARSIPQAVELLGTGGAGALAAGLACTTFLSESLTEEPSREQYWHSSLTSAVAARGLALLRAPRRATEAFAAGLLCDIGRLALRHLDADAYRAVVENARQNRCGIAHVESHLLGVTHARIGGELLAA